MFCYLVVLFKLINYLLSWWRNACPFNPTISATDDMDHFKLLVFLFLRMAISFFWIPGMLKLKKNQNQHGYVPTREIKFWTRHSSEYTNLRPNRIGAWEDLGNAFYDLTTNIPPFISFKDPSNQNKREFVIFICQIKKTHSEIYGVCFPTVSHITLVAWFAT